MDFRPASRPSASSPLSCAPCPHSRAPRTCATPSLARATPSGTPPDDEATYRRPASRPCVGGVYYLTVTFQRRRRRSSGVSVC
ncbi:hypothetical protein BD626DRAFT_631265 [Schizophyllum amplum]|uniref:Uncharacterized protein n=1 Tax=Schizophyllum amplum TaxID=97359 RepID=A0A550CBB0_9AGAR|nr:hypothetical protein BD626DRAFT_631261 [Auriculariopsis ampla]TRM62079.1 hypothetical protein BD626DRAFT_631265 [Auriculariopsis ampla]